MGVIVREKVKGAGVYWVFINHDNKRKSQMIGSRPAAVQMKKKIELQIAQGKWGWFEKEPAPTLTEYATKHWLEKIVKETCRASTYVRYKQVLEKYVLPKIGDKPIDKISRGMVKDLLLGVYSEKSRSTACLVRDVISGPMIHALDEEILSVNPVAGITKTLNLKNKEDQEGQEDQETIQVFDRYEVKHFLSVCQKDFPDLFPIFLTALRTGMRLGELLALEWGDVDFHGGFIQVKRSYRRYKTERTKTSRTRRVDMSDQLRSVLRRLSIKTKEQSLQHGPIKLVFHRQGKQIEQNWMRCQFEGVLKKAGMRKIRFHDLRHTFATLLIMNGESPAYVKEQLGHSSIAMTIDTYTHWIPSSNRAAVNNLDDLPDAAPYTHPPQ